MNDRSINREGQQTQVPIFSEAFHLIALSVLVFLRSSFGYSYLKPVLKTFLLLWVFLLFIAYARAEENTRLSEDTLGIIFYGGAAFTLFFLRAGTASLREFRGTGKHDLYSGRPLLPRLLFLRLAGESERSWKLVGDPLLVGTSAATAHFYFDQLYLASWLAFASIVLFAKECYSFWVFRRRQKPVKDGITDIEELLGEGGLQEPSIASPAHPVNSRKAAGFKERHVEPTGPTPEEIYFATLLDLTFPLSFGKVKKAYKRKARQIHPDKNGSPEAEQESILVNHAWEYFKAQYGK